MKKTIWISMVLTVMILLTGCSFLLSDGNSSNQNNNTQSNSHTCSMGEWVVEQDSTCTKEGREVRKCTICSEVMQERVIPTLEHSFVAVGTKKATCTQPGIADGSRQCRECGYKDFVVIAALGHVYNSDTGACTRCSASSARNTYTVWEEFVSNYEENTSFVLDLRDMRFNDSKDYIVKLSPSHEYIRVIGKEGAVYTNLFFVVEARSQSISINFENVIIRNKSQASKSPIIFSESNCKIEIGFYGTVCELSGMNGKNGKSGSITDLSISNGDDGRRAIDTAYASLSVVCAANSVIIKGGNGGDGGGNPSSVADGGDGAVAIYAKSVEVKFATGMQKDNISIKGGEGGVGGQTVFWFETIKGKPGDSAQASNVQIQYR